MKSHPHDSDESPEKIDPEKELEDTGSINAEEVASEYEDLQAQLATLEDKYIRLSAEFDNYRKRTLREKADLIQTAGESILKDILPFVDDFERGIGMIDQTDNKEGVKKGMELIYTKLIDFLASNGVKEIKAMNESFDADQHEAVTNIPAPTQELKGKVVDVVQKGYTLHDKIIRYPKVVVGE